MNTSRLKAAVGIIAIIGAQAIIPTIVSAADARSAILATSAPVVIERQSVARSAAGKSPRSTLYLRFRNVSTHVADEIHFVAQFNGSQAMIVDKGRFSPEVLVAHAFDAPLGAAAEIAYVHFVDGTHWDADTSKPR
jgi:hypothetical protein